MTLERAARAEVFLDQYSRDDFIARYLSQTAGAGVAYALANVYTPVYLDVIRALIAQRPDQSTFRVLEYGCGGGMHLLNLVDLFRKQGVDIDRAIGADFSSRMITAAREEAARNLPAELGQKLGFAVARNEHLAQDLAESLGTDGASLEGSFDLVVGVNTFRYCHRLKKETDCARDIFGLLKPGGYSVMIDMNRRFPLFRSRLSDMLSRPKHDYYLPTLEEYARPFELAGFTLTAVRNFCWVPHSAAPQLVALCSALAPILDRWCSSFAMRSLVIGQRPAK